LLTLIRYLSDTPQAPQQVLKQINSRLKLTRTHQY
jgi:hypothetical protein